MRKTNRLSIKNMLIVLLMSVCGAASARNWYVDVSRPDDNGDGNNWDTAKKSIQAALDSAEEGDRIVVTNGIYAPIISNNKAITIESVNGAEQTIIDGGGTRRCATLATYEPDAYWQGFVYQTNTVVNGFTLRNGTTDEYDFQFCPGFGGGVLGGAIQNSVLTGNFVTGVSIPSGGGSFGSNLEDCIINGNDGWGAGGVCFSILNRCLVESNTAGYGGGVSGGMVNNSIICNNTALNGDGGVSGSVLNNSIVIYNRITTPYGEIGGIGSYTTVRNSIVLFNENGNGNVSNYPVDYDYWGGEFSYSCTSPLPAYGEGNIDTDPMFVNIQKGLFVVQESSPCIDAGNNSHVVGELDLAGNTRIQGVRVDMGPYERPENSCVVMISENRFGNVAQQGFSFVEKGSSLTSTADETNIYFVGFYTNGVFATRTSPFVWNNITSDGELRACLASCFRRPVMR